MKWIMHKSYKLIPMAVVDLDPDVLIKQIWDTSESLKRHPKIKAKDLTIEDRNPCHLDPGGVLNLDEKWHQFSIDGCDFEVQLSKIGWLIGRVGHAQQRLPGCKRITLFHYNLMCSDEMAKKLLDKLIELEKTPAAFHAKLDDSLMKMELEKRANVRFNEIPREPGDD